MHDSRGCVDEGNKEGPGGDFKTVGDIISLLQRGGGRGVRVRKHGGEMVGNSREKERAGNVHPMPEHHH